MIGRCFACDRKLGRNPALVDTRDSQMVFVGRECWRQIKAAGEAGWQPPKGGPRLYLWRWGGTAGLPSRTSAGPRHPGSSRRCSCSTRRARVRSRVFGR